MTYRDIKNYCDFHEFYKEVFDSLPDGAVVVEVGVWFGHSVAYLATLAKESGKTIRLYAVDHFKGSEEHQKHLAEVDMYSEFIRNIAECGLDYIVTPVKLSSLDAAALFDDKSLDFVFLDGSHDYDSVAKDIIAWEKKVKEGSILAGHDFSVSWPGVIRAVNELYPGAEKIKSVWKVKM